MKTFRWISVAIAIIALAGSGVWIFNEIQDSGELKAENKALRGTLILAQKAAETARLAYEADTKQARKDKAALNAQARKLGEYVARIEKGDSPCLSSDDTDWLRDNWDISEPSAATIR